MLHRGCSYLAAPSSTGCRSVRPATRTSTVDGAAIAAVRWLSLRETAVGSLIADEHLRPETPCLPLIALRAEG